jgi:hypothetical protein
MFLSCGEAILAHEGLFMKTLPLISVNAAAIALLAVSALTQESEKKINRSDLPPAVEKTVVAQSKGATVRGFSQEQEKGKTFYEAKLMLNGKTKDVLMDADGTVVEIEEQVPIESLPPAAHEGLQAEAGNGKIVKVESLTKKDRLVAYEAKVLTNGKHSEVQVGPDGKPLAHEE